jgi:hypothetical protein
MMLLKGIDIWLPKIVKAGVKILDADTENKDEDKNKKRKDKKDE